MNYQTIKTETQGRVGIIRLHRPEAMNALSVKMMNEAVDVLADFENDEAIGAIVLTGDDKAFAAGADIKSMVDKTHLEARQEHFLGDWERVAACNKPVIAAVAGYALGGGCELAMMCDFILAADNAQFGQPEIKIGTIPGLGGTQRLTRLVGKSKAMEMCLTGRMMDASEAERSGLVSRIVPLTELLPEAIKVASLIAEQSGPAVSMARECVRAALNTTLEQGLRSERHSFYSLFGTADQREGMQAFVEKRKPTFSA